VSSIDSGFWVAQRFSAAISPLPERASAQAVSVARDQTLCAFAAVFLAFLVAGRRKLGT